MSKLFAGLIAVEAVLVVAGIAIASASPFSMTQTAAQSDGTPLNACALLTQAEVEAVIGKKMTEGLRRDDGVIEENPYVTKGTYSTTCLWRVVDPDFTPNPDLPMAGASFVILNAMVWPDGPEGAQRFLQGFHDAAKSGEIPSEPVKVELKDAALWWGDGLAGRVNNRSYGISTFIAGDTKPQEKEREEALARKIITRL
jgi:hypothetical protein